MVQQKGLRSVIIPSISPGGAAVSDGAAERKSEVRPGSDLGSQLDTPHPVETLEKTIKIPCLKSRSNGNIFICEIQVLNISYIFHIFTVTKEKSKEIKGLIRSHQIPCSLRGLFRMDGDTTAGAGSSNVGIHGDINRRQLCTRCHKISQSISGSIEDQARTYFQMFETC